MNQDSSSKVSYLRVIVFSFFGLVLGIFLGMLLIAQHPESRDNATFLHIFALIFAVCGAIIGAVLKVEDKREQTQSQKIVDIVIKTVVIFVLLVVVYFFINVWMVWMGIIDLEVF